MDQISENQDSPDHEEHLDQTRSTTRGSGYSSDSFESITDESSGKYDNEYFDTFSSEVGFGNLSVSETESSNSETVEDTADGLCQGNTLIQKWIDTLQGLELNTAADSSGYPSKTVAVHSKRPSGHGGATERELDLLQSYCFMKIKHLHDPPKAHKQKEPHRATHSPNQMAGDHSRLVPLQLFSRLRLDNVKETMKQVTETEMHQPSKCPDCCTKQAELAKWQFLKRKRTQLETSLLQERMEQHMHSKDLVSCIGEIHQSLPRLSDESSIIWQRLYACGKKT